MARLPRVVLPDIPHHITQRGNNRQRTFFEDGDYALYFDLMAEAAHRARTEVWSYCLMPNHVHLILVPTDPDGLWRTLGDAHRRYTGFVNARRRTTGHLCRAAMARWRWTSRTSSPRCAMSPSTRCGRGWWTGRRTGAGRALRR